jgi:hypothetical protein
VLLVMSDEHGIPARSPVKPDLNTIYMLFT